jgi:hypothetical protein
MTPRKSMTKLMLDISIYLKANGFSIGEINTGFVAIDDDGIVFLCSKCRVCAQVKHPQSGQFNIEHRRGIPDIGWFDKQISAFTVWTQDTKGKCPPRKLQVSKRPVPSQLVKKPQ